MQTSTKTNKTSKIKGILFDLDGTLIDTYQTILQSMQYAVKTVLHTEMPVDVLMSNVGKPLVNQIAEIGNSPKQREELLAAYRVRNAEIHKVTTKEFPGCARALNDLLAAGFIVGVVTSKMHKSASEGLHLFGLDEKISCLVGADDCEKHKPEPEPIFRAMKLLDLKPHECVYVGDSPFDIQAGKAAGVITIAAFWGMFSKQELMKQNPDYHCDSITECASLILSKL